VRLGGIYALERIANESEQDHWPIMEVLCTYVRNVAPIKRQQSTQKNKHRPKVQTLSSINTLRLMFGQS